MTLVLWISGLAVFGIQLAREAELLSPFARVHPSGEDRRPRWVEKTEEEFQRLRARGELGREWTLSEVQQLEAQPAAKRPAAGDWYEGPPDPGGDAFRRWEDDLRPAVLTAQWWITFALIVALLAIASVPVWLLFYVVAWVLRGFTRNR
jgi:hypothetical protein